MIHSSFSSEGHFLPKRTVFDFTGPSRNNDRPGSAEHIKSAAEDLSALGLARVTEDLTRSSLEDLRGGVELQQSAQQREEQEVNALVLKSSIEKGLDNPEQREQFMSDVQLRLAVTLALLVNDQEIPLSHLQSGSIDATIQELLSKKDTIKIGERNLYNHEKALLGLPATLSGHTNNDVKAAWETMKGSLMANVQILRSTARIITETEAEESESFSLPEEAQKVLEAVKKQWAEASPATRGIAIAAGAIGSLWLLKRMFQGTTQGGKSKLWSTLGIGALLAGGLYIAGKYMSFNEALDKLKATFRDLEPTKLKEGLTAYFSRDLESAKKFWGEHYDAIVASLPTLPGKGEEERSSTDNSPSTREVGRESVRFTSVGEAFANYQIDLRRRLAPIAQAIDDNSVLIGGGALYLGIRNFGALAGGITAGADSIISYAKLLGYAALRHPLRSFLIVSGFMISMQAAGRLQIPESINDLKSYIKGSRDELVTFMQDNNLSGEVKDEHIDLAIDVLNQEKGIQDLGEPLENLGQQMSEGVREALRQTPFERVRARNEWGLRHLKNQLYTRSLSNPSQQLEAFIAIVDQLETSSSQGNPLSPENITNLQTLAIAAGVKIEARSDHKIWWGYSNTDGTFINPNEVYTLAIDPKATPEQQAEASQTFVPDPDSMSSMGGLVQRQVLEDLRNGGAQTLERIQKNEIELIFVDGTWMLFDGFKEKFFQVPANLVQTLTGNMQVHEFVGHYGDALVPVAIFTGATYLSAPRAVAKLTRWRKAKALIKLATFPVSAPYQLLTGTYSNVWDPMRLGAERAGYLGTNRTLGALSELFEHNAGRMKDIVQRLGVGFERQVFRWASEQTRASYAARATLLEARALVRQAHLIGEASNARIYQELLAQARQKLMNNKLSRVADLIQHGAAREGIDIIDNSLKHILRGATRVELSVAEVALNAMKSGRSIPGSAFATLRGLARDTSRVAELGDLLRGAGVGGDHVEVVIRALASEKNLLDLSQTLRNAGLITDANNIARGASLIDEAVDLVTAASPDARAVAGGVESIADGARIERATAKGIEVVAEGSRVSPAVRTALTEIFEGVESGRAMSGLEASRLRSLALTAPDELALGLKQMQIAENKIPQLIEMLKSVRGKTSEVAVTIAEALRTARMGSGATEGVEILADTTRLTSETAETLADTVRTGGEGAEVVSDGLRLNTTLSETLEGIRIGQPLEPEHLARIRLAVKEGATAEEIAAAIRARGATQETAEAAVRVLQQEKHIGKLMQALDTLGVLRFGKALRGLGNVSLRCISFAGRVAAPIAPLVGVGFNGYQAYVAWEMAKEFKHNPELQDLYENKSEMFITAGFADIAIEALYFAGKVGVKGNFALSTGVMALQYMVEGAMDARAETLMGSNDYIRIGKTNGIEELLHRWYTTGEDTNAGEKYDSVFTFGNRGQEHYEFHRAFTREKIIDALLTLTSQGQTDEFIRYRKNYIASQAYNLNVFNFQQGQQLLANSLAFASIMEDRSKQLEVARPEGGTEVILLSDERFDIHRISSENINRIYRAGRDQFHTGFQLFLSEGRSEAEAQQLFRRVRDLDRNYLNHSISMMYAFHKSAGKGVDKNSLQKWVSLSTLLVSYLQYEGVTVTLDPSATGDARSMAAMNQVYFNTNLSPRELESLKGEYARPSAAVAALYETAQFYGYKGRPREEDLKLFFNEAHEGMYGIYWKGGEWRTNEVGRSTADSRHGRSLDEAVVAIIRRFRAHPDRILESRHDYLTDELFGEARDDEVRRHDQIRLLMTRMEHIYQNYEAPDLEYQLEYLEIPEEQRRRLHELMGDSTEEYDEYSMRRIVLLYKKSLREPFIPEMETRSFRLWAQTESPKRASVLEYFRLRQNNFNMAGIEDRRILSQLNTDLGSFDAVFEDLTTMGVSQQQVGHIRLLYNQVKQSIETVIGRIDHQEIHPINNPTWVQWSEIQLTMNQLRELNDEYSVLLHDFGVMDYWRDNGERDRFREKQRRRKTAAEVSPAIEVIDRDPEVIRAKKNISFEIDSLILLLNRSQIRNRKLEENYINALNTIRQKVASQTSLNDCLQVFRWEMENFQRDFNRGFVGVDVVDVKKLWEGNGGYSLATVQRLMDTIIHRQITISAREAREDLVGEVPNLQELNMPTDRLERAKFNLKLEVNYLKREVNRMRERDSQFESEYLRRLVEIERNVSSQQSYEACLNTFKTELNNFFVSFINPNANKINQLWGQRYFDVMVDSFRSLVGATANLHDIAGREITAEAPVIENTNESPRTEYDKQVQRVRDLNTQMNTLVRQINDAAASNVMRARYRGISRETQGARVDINQLRRDSVTLQEEIEKEERRLAEMRESLGIANENE